MSSGPEVTLTHEQVQEAASAIRLLARTVARSAREGAPLKNSRHNWALIGKAEKVAERLVSLLGANVDEAKE